MRTAAAGEDEPNRGRWVNFGPPGPPWEMSKMSRREYDGDGSGKRGDGDRTAKLLPGPQLFFSQMLPQYLLSPTEGRSMECLPESEGRSSRENNL